MKKKMKKQNTLLTLLLSLLCVACGEKPPAEVVTTHAQSESFLDPFQNTAALPEAKLLEISAAGLKSGLILSAARAEHCWREEEKRPAVREACVLLWAGGGESNPLLDEALAQGLGQSKSMGVAALIRKTPLRGLPFSRLIDILSSFAGEPVWLKAKAVDIWMDTNRRPSIWERRALKPYLPSAETLGPRDIAASLRVSYRMSAADGAEAIKDYCDAGVRGEARVRCWKMVGAMTTAGLDPEIKAQLRPFLPEKNDPDWQLFERSFPVLAQKINQNF